MFTYKMNAQFVNGTSLFDDSIREEVKKAIENYNSKSLIAKNPKQIVDYSYSNDGVTLIIELESEAELPMPTKALRILSTYLSECLDKSYLSPNGKQLFKMSVVSDADVDSNGIIDSDDNLSLEEFKSLSVDDKLVEIYKLLTRR
ncbi:hypothetical protein [Roseburia sp. 499]|uniref:hypothetical protein n=1 Tax=Roseburia sp. 499 TaxID=1261634 RepID=UPI000952E316|nr:hypothetical protein [Roseburia sp. 499]WVK69912.1 hypothetical protein BIV20_16475 [Roseburia sp. 499]